MEELLNNALFWQKLDTIYLSNKFVITKNKNEKHLLYPNLVYPTIYGYLEETGSENKEICIFKGSNDSDTIQAVVVCADILKKDLECKLLVGCNENEEKQILHFLNQTDFQKCLLIRRNADIPSWAVSE